MSEPSIEARLELFRKAETLVLSEFLISQPRLYPNENNLRLKVLAILHARSASIPFQKPDQTPRSDPS